MLMKLTHGVNFTNNPQAAFSSTDPESAKNIDNFTVFFTFVICVHKLCSQNVNEIDPWTNFANNIHKYFFNRNSGELHGKPIKLNCYLAEA